MALGSFSGFETGDLGTPWDFTSGTPTVESTSPRSGTGSYYAQMVAEEVGFNSSSSLSWNWDPSTDTLYCGFAMRLQHGSGISEFSIGVNGGFNALHYCTLSFETDGSVGLYVADSIIGNDDLIGSSTSGTIADNTWHYIEIQFWPDASSGRIRLVVDGSTPTVSSGSLDFTGDTLFDTNRTAGNINMRWDAGSGATMDVDDYYSCDDTTSGNDPFTGLMGEQVVEAIVPTSDSSIAWTRSTGANSYALVDEIPPSESDYVETTTATDEDIYGLGNTTLSGTANAVSIWLRAWQNTVTTGQVRSELNSSGSTTNGATHNLSGTGTDFVDFFPVDPNASGAWNNTAVDAATASIYCVAVT